MKAVLFVKLVMMSDTHYISRRMLCNPDNRLWLNQIEVTEQALKQAAEEDTDTIIISGDLTDDGDLYSNEDFVELLRDLKSKGKNVYVIFATHDFHHHRAYVRMKDDTPAQFNSRPWEMPYYKEGSISYHDYVKDEFKGLSEEECTPKLVRSVTPEELWEMYREFGPDQAYSVFEPDFSYCIDLDEKTRVLMLNDIFRNEEALADISASFTPGCFRWMEKMIAEAKRDGKFIFAVSHHPLIPVVPAHRLMTGPRNLRTPYTAHILADMGINLAFTGHTHATDVGYACSDAGNYICDIATPSVRFFPPYYRMLDLDGLNGKLSYRMVEIKKPETMKIDKESLYEFYRKDMYDEYYRDICGKNNFIGKKLRKLKVGDVYFLFRGAAKLTKEEYNEVKDMKMFDYVFGLVLNMMEGKSEYEPGSAGYKLGIGIAAVVDSVVDAQPFKDLRKSVFKGYTAFEVIEPLLFTNGASNKDDTIDFTKGPVEKFKTQPAKSHMGPVLMAVLSILVIILSPLAPVGSLALYFSKIAKKNRQLKDSPAKIMYRY